MNRQPLMTADDIAEELQVSSATAYRLMGQMVRTKLGRIVRVTRQSFEMYLKRHEDNPCKDSINAEIRTGSPSKRAKVNGGSGIEKARANVIDVPRRESPENSNALPQIRPVQPRTKPRSALPSNASSPIGPDAGERGGR